MNGQQISKIKRGLCVLIGLSVDDTTADLDYMVKKLLSVRVFDSSHTAQLVPPAPLPTECTDAVEEPNRMWANSVVDIGGEILCGMEI